jgi:hypothetical protein
VFTAARSRAAAAVGFFPLANAFEVYGLDFLLDEDGAAWLLEVGPGGTCRHCFWHNRHIENSSITPGILGILSGFRAFS